MTKNEKDELGDALDAAAEQGFEETLSTSALEEKVFTIQTLRGVDTKFGRRHIAEIVLEDKEAEAWLNGVVVDRQIRDVLLGEGVLPVTVRLIKDGRFDPPPYRLENVKV